MILVVPYLVYLFSCVRVAFAHVFSQILYFVFVFVFSTLSSFLLQYSDLGHISEKKRLGKVISNERDFSVSLETKKLVILRLHKRQNGWKEKLKVTTLS